MHLFDPKSRLLMTIAGTLTSDFKAGFMGRQTRKLALQWDLTVRKDTWEVKCFPLRFIIWSNEAIPVEGGCEVFSSH